MTYLLSCRTSLLAEGSQQARRILWRGPTRTRIANGNAAAIVATAPSSCRRTFCCCRAVLQASSPKPASAVAARQALRNVSFWGHIDAGKTTLTEKVLYLANALLPPEPVVPGANRAEDDFSNGMLPGDVDSGSTVTDFLEAERQRGITIQSAAVGPFSWSSTLSDDGLVEGKGAADTANITLIDTPGHIDFSIEVERSLRVADGCVVLIDGVEGVESQTEGVWRIAQRYNVRSHIVFVNKMDRMGSSLVRSLRSILARGLHARPTLLQLPIFTHASQSKGASAVDQQALVGLVDLTSYPLQAHFYGGKAGENVTKVTLEEAVQQGKTTAALVEEATRARAQIVEQLANLDETLLEQTFAAMEKGGDDGGDYTSLISADSVRQAVRRLVVRGEILPVLCGSAAKGVGVQAVLDAIAAYLPSPGEAGDFDAATSRDQQSGCVWGDVRVQASGSQNKKQLKHQRRQAASASPIKQQVVSDTSRVSVSIDDAPLSLLAFKVVWDKRRGPMTFVRVYSGSITRQTTLLNTNTGARERLSKILHVYADRHVETDKLEAGQIGVLLGLKDTRTGDTLVDVRPSAAVAHARKGKGKSGSDQAISWPAYANTLALRRVDVPPPVFSMSIEALSKSDEPSLSEALDMLIRCDPSLQLDQAGEAAGAGLGSVAASTGGQAVLSGMGELHLEIARDRLTGEFGARAHLGNVRVSYRETLQESVGADVASEVSLDRTVMGQKLKAACQITVRNLTADEVGEARLGGNVIVIDQSQPAEYEDDDDDDDDGQSKRAAEEDAEPAASGEPDTEATRRALQGGLLASLSRGPLSGNPVMGLHIQVDKIVSFGATLTPLKAYSQLTAQALRDILKQRGTVLMEPFMNVRIRCGDEFMGKVVSNLTSEQDGMVEHVEHDNEDREALDASIRDQSANFYIPSSSAVDGPTPMGDAQTSGGTGNDGVGTAEGKCTISAVLPLVKLVRYNSVLRSMTRGKASYEMTFNGFNIVAPERQRSLLVEMGRARD